MVTFVLVTRRQVCTCLPAGALIVFNCKQNMSRFLVVLKRPLLALLLFLVFQTMAGMILLVARMVTGSGDMSATVPEAFFDANLMGIATFACNVLMALSCLYLFRRSLYTNSDYVPSSTHRKRSQVAILACILGTMALNLLSEMVALPNIMEEQMMAMCREPWGMLAIAIGAPLGEEVMFRWGIMGHMLRRNVSAPLAIVVSSVLFGLLHMNPAQVFFATVMGIMLGILYCRSGNLFWPFLLHFLNNSVACLQVWFMGDKVRDYSMVEAVGGTSVAWVMIVVSSLICTCILWWYVGGTENGEVKTENDNM